MCNGLKTLDTIGNNKGVKIVHTQNMGVSRGSYNFMFDHWNNFVGVSA